MRGTIAAVVAGLIVAGAVFLSGSKDEPDDSAWKEIAPGVWRTQEMPFGYALMREGKTLLIDAPVGPESLPKTLAGVEAVLLTHAHRDTVEAASAFIKAGVPVRAGKASEEFLNPESVAKHWIAAAPMHDTRTPYFLVPEGIKGVAFDIDSAKPFVWRGLKISPLATPGHSPDHVSYMVTFRDGSSHLFAGDAVGAFGKLWTPFTTDWDHWQDLGLTPQAASLKALAALKPDAIYPAHGEPWTEKPAETLTKLAKLVEEAALLKSFERYSDRKGDSPKYPFLVPMNQIGSAGKEAWSKIAPRLWITGNTYVLASEDGPVLVVDPWGQRAADNVAALIKAEKLGPVERVMISHAHADHYDGVYALPDRKNFEVWTLDRVAEVLRRPGDFRQPATDGRPIVADRTFRDGESAKWRGYEFTFMHLPGQTVFACGIRTTIDNKNCVFTGDNFFHREQYSGSGGWMGLNRGLPEGYARSARKILDLKPDWVLAEHGGPYKFSPADYERRAEWADDSGKTIDQLCATGTAAWDWNPQRITVVPVAQKYDDKKPARWTVTFVNPLGKAVEYEATLQGRGLFEDVVLKVQVPAKSSVEKVVEVNWRVAPPVGRSAFVVRNRDPFGVEGVDAFALVDRE